MNLPYELVIKILVEFDGRFVFRKGKLIFIKKLLKDDARYEILHPMIPHPKLYYYRLEERIFPRVYLKISPEKEYVISLWFEEDITSVDVLLSIKIKGYAMLSEFIGSF
jgi:hypothetical protein